MIVVVEGPDNAGKSTLVAHLMRELGLVLIPGEGPAISAEEINDRVERFLQLDNVIFDRHPCVSQMLYNAFREGPDIRQDLLTKFYQSDILFVYCRGRPHVEGHVLKDVDERKDANGVRHADTVKNHYTAICTVYDMWALQWSHINYRIGDGFGLVTRLVAEAMRLRFDPIGDIIEFHNKFDLKYDGPPRTLPTDLHDFRVNFLREEVDEFDRHASHCHRELDPGLYPDGSDQANYTYHLAHQLDAHIDLLYVDFGTTYLQGFSRTVIQEAWRRVHKANMSKVRASHVSESTRNSLFDVVKPKDWIAPNHVDLVEQNDVSLKR